MNGGGAEHPRSEGWSFPCLFCGTQVTRVVGPFLMSKGPPLLRTFVHFWRGGGPSGAGTRTEPKVYLVISQLLDKIFHPFKQQK